MKNKAMTYVLLILVIGLWGYIIHKIFSAAPDGDQGQKNKKKDFTPTFSDLSFYRQKKTTALLLNYPDPMLKESDMQPLSPTPKAQPDHIPAVAQNHRPEPQLNVQYIGFIENLSDKKPTAIVMIVDRQYMMNAGDQQKQVKLIAIRQDHIRIKVNGKNKIIFKNGN